MLGADTLIAELVLQVTGLKSEIAQLRAIVSNSPALVEGWANEKVAAAALRNEGIEKPRQLKRLRLEGVFTEGKDVRNVSKGDRPTWEYHIPSCRKALARRFKTTKV
jgi:hypothetical protein